MVWVVLGAHALAAATSTEDVVWTGAVGVSVSGNQLTKTAGTGWGNAGAASAQDLSSSGFVEFTALETNTTRAIGLSQGDTNRDYQDIDFALYLGSDGLAYVYEGGTLRGSFGSYASGDRFRVEVAAGLVRYRKNGVLLYTSASAPGFPMLIDTALNSSGATLADVTIGRGGFTKDVGILVTEQTVTKTSTTGWNAGAASAQRILWGDGFVEFTAAETNKRRAAGLSRGDDDQTLEDIDFALILNADASVEIQESGTSLGQFGSYSASDRFRVEVAGGAVTYYCCARQLMRR